MLKEIIDLVSAAESAEETEVRVPMPLALELKEFAEKRVSQLAKMSRTAKQKIKVSNDPVATRNREAMRRYRARQKAIKAQSYSGDNPK